MDSILIAAIRFVDATYGPRKTEIERLEELKLAVQNYKVAHQGVSESSSNLRSSSSSIRRASAL